MYLNKKLVDFIIFSQEAHIDFLSHSIVYIIFLFSDYKTCVHLSGDPGYPLEPWLLTPSYRTIQIGAISVQ